MSDAGDARGPAKIVETRLVADDEADVRLDRWFKRHFPELGHGALQKLLRTGQVRVDGKRADANTRLAPGQSVRIPPLPDAAPVAAGAAVEDKPRKPVFSDKEIAALRACVLYRDADVIVLDKPAGMAVQGGTGQDKHLDAMLDLLKFDAEGRPKLVHRLDKDTSGCLVLARNSFAASRLTESFRGRDARKIYWAITVGVPEPHQGRIDLSIAKEMAAGGERMMVDERNGQRAQSYYTVLEHAHRKAAFVALWPRTGRTHQLRVHMNAIGTPILGDGKYAGQEAFIGGAEVKRQLHLHARRIIIPHPRGGTVDVTAPLPEHMRPAWDYFGFSMNLKEDPFMALD
ncbi:RluA family pseudouridine synthase [Niveispirillum sp. KHB5.9]|uniref:RluA family pseudouridine synthase n=1 Tax=Niveispirillum sp. KHB5.9 TaxID=3400269 RepID=UPI003A8A9207